MTTLEGIDVSEWQDTTPSLAGRSFVFARATYNTAKDGRFDMHARNVQAQGRVLGAYAFGTCHASGADQARAFLGAVGDRSRLVALDLESERHRRPDGSFYYDRMTDAQGRDFIAELHRFGRRVGLYHSLSGFPDLGQDFDWIAAWGFSSLARTWTFWQYRGSPLDLDRFNGSLEQLLRLASLTPPDTSTQEDRMIVGGGLTRTSNYVVPGVKPGTVLFEDAPCTVPVTKVYGDKPVDLEYYGIADGASWAVEFATAATFTDGKVRPVIGYVRRSDVAKPVAKPPAPAPEDSTPFDQAYVDRQIVEAVNAYKAGEADRTEAAIAQAIAEDRKRAVGRVVVEYV